VKVRLGWVSNSSSSSFIIASKSSSREDAAKEAIRDLFWTDSDRTDTHSQFIQFLRDDIAEALIDEDNDDYEIGLFEWDRNPNDSSDLSICYAGVIEDVETLGKYLEIDIKKLQGPVSKKVVDFLRSGQKLYLFNVPDYGEGGSLLQTALRASLHTEGPVIALEDVWREVNESRELDKIAY
jgi:hypothetical protein